ncbi:MAG: class A beta-lactamase [Comamonadaceae bacterium]|nr:MAG: class A beta-lactamase [Comamonadaceae bacterium]
MVSQTRRELLMAAAAAPLVAACGTWPMEARSARLAALESESGGRLGVSVREPGRAAPWGHRQDERFPMCSTFKLIAASGVLALSASDTGLLDRRIAYTKAELVSYSPVTQQHAGDGMTVAQLCAAALQYSDNTAGNLLIRLLGGTEAVTAYARSIGDNAFRLDRWETELNTAIPGDWRDTTTPAAMAMSLERVALGDALGAPQRAQLVAWLRGNTTGAARIRAGVPADWQVGDKTGGGDWGTTNDVAVLWPPGRPPLVVAMYFTQPQQDAAARSDVLAAAARIVAAV